MTALIATLAVCGILAIAFILAFCMFERKVNKKLKNTGKE